MEDNLTLTQRLTEILEKYLILHNKDCKECKIEIKYALSAILTAIRAEVEGMKKEIIAYTPNDPDRVHNRILNDILEKLK